MSTGTRQVRLSSTVRNHLNVVRKILERVSAKPLNPHMAIQEPAMKNAMAFFDGQNLFQHATEAFGHYHPNYDPRKLHVAVCEQEEWRPTLTRFYTGVPIESEDRMWAGYWSNRVLAMKRAGIHVTTRPLRYRTETVFDHNGAPVMNADGTQKIVTTPQEKGIDVRLALDLISLARKKQFDVALGFSQDQDLKEVVQEVAEISKEQDRWIKVACALPSGTARGIDNTQCVPMGRDFYNNCLDTHDYRPRRK